MEPIRFPSAIQPHGALLVVDTSTRLITHASENTERLLGLDPLQLLGQPARDVFDSSTVSALTAVLRDEDYASNPTLTSFSGRPFDVIVHHVHETVVIELEPHFETPREMILGTRRAMRRFAEVRSVIELQKMVAAEFRDITGFDRVMVEHFDSDGHGEIVAESAASGLPSRVGERIPASTIVPHSMILAAIKKSRMIVNIDAPAIALLADPEGAYPEAPDLSMTELRAVTAHHLAFMRDFDMASSFVLSLVQDDTLVGMIHGGHRIERRLPYNIRDGFEILANQVSLQLASMRDIEKLAARKYSRELRDVLDAQLMRTGDLVEALFHQHVTILDLIPADGAAIRRGDQVESIGAAPDKAILGELGSALAAAGVSGEVATSKLSKDHHALAATLSGFPGLLLMPLNHEGDYLAWFRRERDHFPGWTHEFEGTSEPWEALPSQARELTRDLQAALLRQAESRLAALALSDPLTGLGNRRLLMDRLQSELSRTPSHGKSAVLFIDLDDFKSINDQRGHATGDDALRHTATAIRAAARTEDTVARVGGDEFVVLTAAVSTANARAMAERILAAVASPPTNQPGLRLSASIGLTMAEHGADPSQVLSAADSAMYRAKQAGKGTISE